MAQVRVCPRGGHRLPEAGPRLQAVYDKIELPPVKPSVTHVEPYGGCCAGCGQPYVVPVPTGMEPTTPLGASIQSPATYLRYTHAISDEHLSELFAEVLGLDISEGGLANVCQPVKVHLDQRVAAILTRLRSRRLICRDETSARVHGWQQWAWVFQNPEVCIHVIRPSQGQGVMQAMLGAHRPTIWVSDLYSAQKEHPAEPWQICLAHQVRHGQFAFGAGDTVFAPRMKRRLLRALAMYQRRDPLAASTLYQCRRDLRRRVDRCLASQSLNPHGRRLQKRSAKILEHLFLFLEDATMPPTNNPSEQAIRLSTVFRKVANGFRSDQGRDLFAAVRSAVKTGKSHGLSAFQTIQKALSPMGFLFIADPG